MYKIYWSIDLLPFWSEKYRYLRFEIHIPNQTQISCLWYLVTYQDRKKFDLKIYLFQCNFSAGSKKAAGLHALSSHTEKSFICHQEQFLTRYLIIIYLYWLYLMKGTFMFKNPLVISILIHSYLSYKWEITPQILHKIKYDF